MYHQPNNRISCNILDKLRLQRVAKSFTSFFLVLVLLDFWSRPCFGCKSPSKCNFLFMIFSIGSFDGIGIYKRGNRVQGTKMKLEYVPLTLSSCIWGLDGTCSATYFPLQCLIKLCSQNSSISSPDVDLFGHKFLIIFG